MSAVLSNQDFLGSLWKGCVALFLFLADFVAFLAISAERCSSDARVKSCGERFGIVLATGKVCLRHPAAILRAGDC